MNRDSVFDTSPVDFAVRANDALLAGEFESAESLIRRSLAWETRSGNLDGQADDWGTLGLVHLLRGELAVARDCLMRAYRLHCRLGEVHAAAIDLMNLSQVATGTKEWLRAVRLLRRAAAQFASVGDSTLLSKSRRLLVEAERILAVCKHDARLN